MKITQFMAFQCSECGMISILPSNTSDGMGCLECNGMIKPIGYAKIKPLSRYHESTPPSTGSSVHGGARDITVKVSVDTSDIDHALEKFREMGRIFDKIYSNE